MFSSKKIFALCATSIVGFSGVASMAPVSVFADTSKSGDTVITYEGAPQPAEWGLSVPSTLSLENKSVEKLGNATYTLKNCKVSIVKEDGSDYTDTQDRTFNLTGEVANNGNFVGTKDSTKQVALNAKIMDVGDPHEKDDTWSNYGISGSTLKDHPIEIGYKADGSQKSERYIKFYSELTESSLKTGLQDLVEAGAGQMKTSVSWTASEKTT